MLNQQYNLTIITCIYCLCGIFIHAGRPEKNEFYLCGLLKIKKNLFTCVLCWSIGVVTDLATVQSTLRLLLLVGT